MREPNLYVILSHALIGEWSASTGRWPCHASSASWGNPG